MGMAVTVTVNKILVAKLEIRISVRLPLRKKTIYQLRTKAF